MVDRHDTNYFEDSASLSELLTDARAKDERVISTKDEARAAVDDIRGRGTLGSWKIDRDALCDRLLELVEQPRLVQQGKLPLCGPAAFVCMWAARDPAAFVSFAGELYDTGSAAIGDFPVEPSDDLLEQDFAALRLRSGTEPADWMVLSAIRNTDSPFWQPEWTGGLEQLLAGVTRPEELAGWLRATGIYANVRDEGNWLAPAGIPHATGIEMFEGRDVALLIHLNMLRAARHRGLDKTFLLSLLPNHFVVALNSPRVDARTGAVHLSVWSFGQSAPYLDIAVPRQAFVDNYYGAIVADLV